MTYKYLMVVAIACASLALCRWLYRKIKLKMEPHDYIKVLDHEHWKSFSSIQSQMEELHHGILDSTEVFASLIILEEEGKIISRSFLQITPEGKREIHEFKLEFGSDNDDRPTSTEPPPVSGCARSISATKQNPAFRCGIF